MFALLNIENRIKPFVAPQRFQQTDGAGHHIVAPGGTEFNRQSGLGNHFPFGACGDNGFDGAETDGPAQEGPMAAFGKDLLVT